MPRYLRVDHAGLRTNQTSIVSLLAAAFVLDSPWVVLAVCAVMLIGSLRRKPGFNLIYRLLRSLGVIQPDLREDNPQPHRFAQTFGGVVLAASFLFLFFHLAIPGWALVVVVIALAALNLFTGFCVGCAIYYWLNRIGFPGFDHPAAQFPPTQNE
jgi:hypothetical protein